MNTKISKQLIPLRGKPIIVYTLLAFEEATLVDEVVLVVNKGVMGYYERNIIERYGIKKVKRIVAGGVTRQESVYNGLQKVSEQTKIVAIHDGARPLVTPELIDRSIQSLGDKSGLVVSIPVQDTIKIVGSDQVIKETPDRRRIWAAQTPQVFPLEIIRKAHEMAKADGFVGTDDGSLVERVGLEVSVMLGSKENIKITTPLDLTMAQVIMSRR
ncbi:2-C-methyl-D-erythritol 4-phosphate cytidylyltransferase [Candidatus Hakubella thermalkaliphila]|uniref:2-C-methyl-D-erythritol 4-phosphate cytidylyltransferase n=4 Tax=Candidatus Hakubella thermalkaliphila TaxID=2754717 RepID=A0A6V8Q3Z4_9ACTN|nr:2-C-methyl-D-erythritol 4-phosphate cytidylyltransferase [Candidatus Hakubella thermalkaliphila]